MVGDSGVGLGSGVVAAVIVATAPVSLPMLALGVLAGVVVGLGVHDGITQYQETGEVCVKCILGGMLEGAVWAGAGIALVAGAALIGPEVAAVAGGIAIAVGIESLVDTLITWDNKSHDDRMRATGGVLGGVFVGLGASAYQGLRGLFKGSEAPGEEPGGKLGENEGEVASNGKGTELPRQTIAEREAAGGKIPDSRKIILTNTSIIRTLANTNVSREKVTRGTPSFQTGTGKARTTRWRPSTQQRVKSGAAFQ